jgi:hypothetical protein
MDLVLQLGNSTPFRLCLVRSISSANEDLRNPLVVEGFGCETKLWALKNTCTFKHFESALL